MKRYFLTTLFILLAAFAPLQAENYLKYIVSRPAEKGMLYFVLPSKAECREEGAHKGSKLTFDVTYISPGDSLRLNASLLLPQIQKVDSLTFQDAQGKNPDLSHRTAVLRAAKIEMGTAAFHTSALCFCGKLCSAHRHL